MDTDKTRLYEALAEQMAGLITQGVYPPGERIPSVREMSRQHNVSISTVLQAYRLLEDRGLVEARPQSGYYVRRQTAERLPEPDMSRPEKGPRPVSLHELVMRLMRDAANPNLVHLGAAVPNSEYLPAEKLVRLLNTAARRHGAQALQYMVPPGLESLRVQIARRALQAGCSLSPSDIVITSGGNEAIDLCLQAVCQPGDIVAIESPAYFGTLQLMEVRGLRALEIPTHPREGISLEALAFALAHHPVRAVLVIPNFNNPLGSLMPEEKKKELVELVARYDLPLIENDVCGELFFGEKRPLTCKAFDKHGRVMLISSFSKDLGPGLRVGWAAPGRLQTQLEWLKFTVSLTAPSLTQLAVAEFLQSGGYDAHLRRIRREYARNAELMSEAVMRYFPPGARLTRPAGGLVLWVQLPEQILAMELYPRALAQGITLAPGDLFSTTRQFSHFVRLNITEFNYRTERALETLGQIIKQMASERGRPA
jgi:DNA-binding transcriptional MocR family regulator